MLVQRQRRPRRDQFGKMTGRISLCRQITANGTVVSRTTVSRVANIEDQTDEKKERITALDKVIQERLNYESHVVVKGGGEPKDWSEHPFDRDSDFKEEFSHFVSNNEVAEADNEILTDVYNDTYLIMDLAFPKRGELDP